MSDNMKLRRQKLEEDWRIVRDALDTASDALLPDPLYGPMFGKADTAMKHIKAALLAATREAAMR